MIQQHYRERARRLAQHEMGHYVIATVMGFGAGEVSVELLGADGHNGRSMIHLDQPISCLTALTSYLERRVVVLFAGALAETLTPSHTPGAGVNGDMASKIIHTPALGAAQDYAKAREAMRLLRNVQHLAPCSEDDVNRQMIAISDRLWDRALELVEQFETTIVGVAGVLTQTLQSSGCGRTLVISGKLSAETLKGIPSIQDLPRLDP